MLRSRIASLAALTVIVALLAFAQNRLMVQALGAGELVDAYYLIMTLPMAVTTVFAVLSMNLVTPSYTSGVARERLEGVGRLVLTGVALVVALLVLQVPVSILSGFWEAPGGGTAWAAALLLCSGAAAYGLSYSVQPLLVARGRADWFSYAQIANALVFIAALAAGLGRSLTGLATLFTGSAIVQAAVTIFGLSRVAVIDWSLRSPIPERTRKRIRHGILAAAAAVAFSQGSLVVDRAFASAQGVGVVTTYYLADRIVQMLVSVSAVALGMVVFAEFSEAEDAHSSRVLGRAIQAVVAIFAPIAAVLWVCAPSVVGLLFGGGRFDAGAVAQSGMFLRYLSLALVPLALVVVVPRRIQAAGRYGVQARVAFGILIANLLLKSILVPAVGLLGLPVSVAAAYGMAGLAYAVYLLRSGLVSFGSDAVRGMAIAIVLSVLFGAVGRIAWGAPGAGWFVAPVALLALWAVAAAAHDGIERDIARTAMRVLR